MVSTRYINVIAIEFNLQELFLVDTIFPVINKNDTSTLLERLSRVLQNDAHSKGLKPTQWAALRYLAQANRFSSNPKGLTAYLGMTKGTVSQTLNALERKELVKKKLNSLDRRNVQLELTTTARKLLQDDPIHSIDKLVSGFDEQTSNAIQNGLKSLLKELLKQRNGKAFDMCNTCIHFQADVDQGKPHRCGLLKVPLTIEDSVQICIESQVECKA